MGFATIDLGKFKSVACVLDAATRQQRFCTFDTTPAALHELLRGSNGDIREFRKCADVPNRVRAGSIQMTPRRWR